MSHDQEEIFVELSKTLDQLLQNAKALQTPNVALLDSTEVDLLNKTQESLSSHFLHTKEHLESKKRERSKKLDEKLAKIEAVDPALYDTIVKTLVKAPVVGFRPRIGRNRKRSNASEFAYCSF